MNPTTTLSPQVQPVYEKLEKKLSSSAGTLTLGDAASITGSALDDAKYAIEALMAKYHCKLTLTEHGDLVYDFGKSLFRRGEKTWAERWEDIKDTAWKVFVVVFKVWITVTLVVYFALFVIIMIAVMIAMMAGNNNEDNNDRRGMSFFDMMLISELFRSIFIWNTLNRGSYHYEVDEYGYRYRVMDYRPESSAGLTKKAKKGFVASVYDFVFGPERVEADPLANQQEIASYVRENKGVLVPQEVIGLSGLPSNKADDLFTECLVRFDGKADVTEKGAIFGDFYELTRSTKRNADAPVIWYWDEYEADYKLTGNKQSTNIGVGFMNAFNLAFATFFLTAEVPNVDPGAWMAIQIGLGFVPFTFSLVFFMVPILRSFNIRSKRKKREQANIKKRVMKQVFKQADKPLNPETLTNWINLDNRGESKLTLEQVQHALDELALDLDAVIDADANGKTVYKFEKLKEGLTEANRLRQQRGATGNLGKSIMEVG